MTDQPDIEAIVERHNGSHSVRCVYWANSDPNETRCDTAIVIERLRAVEAERDDIKSWCDDQISIQLTLQDRANDEIDKRRAVEAERDQLQRQAEALPEALARGDVELQKAFDRANDEVTDLTASFDRARAERDRWREDAREVWDSIPSSYDDTDPLVQRHARALNALGVALAAHDAMTMEQ